MPHRLILPVVAVCALPVAVEVSDAPEVPWDFSENLSKAYAQEFSGTSAGDISSDPFAEFSKFNVLFIGNSHLFVNDVPLRVKTRLLSKAKSVHIKTFAHGGARLIDFVHRADVASALENADWHAVVLQEATASFLSSAGRRQFHRAINWFVRKISPPTRIIVYQTWPWRNDSPFLRGRSSAGQLWKTMMVEYAKLANQPRLVIAPVGTCWVTSPARNSFYSSDGNHAAVAGSRFAAKVISRTILGERPGDC
ncbi:MAG: hypothetical protein ACR2PG_07950 [Hyphomicrobiaceae bacterium]